VLIIIIKPLFLLLETAYFGLNSFRFRSQIPQVLLKFSDLFFPAEEAPGDTITTATAAAVYLDMMIRATHIFHPLFTSLCYQKAIGTCLKNHPSVCAAV